MRDFLFGMAVCSFMVVAGKWLLETHSATAAIDPNPKAAAQKDEGMPLVFCGYRISTTLVRYDRETGKSLGTYTMPKRLGIVQTPCPDGADTRSG